MNKVRFRNHISTLPQPNFGDSATKIRHASATKKRRFRNQKRTDSATKKRRFRNQKKAIPLPKQEDFATKKRQFPNHHPHDSETNIRVTIAATVNIASSPDAGGVGWGGVGWDNNVLAAAFLPLTHLRPRSTWHRLQMRGGWGGVGWGGVG